MSAVGEEKISQMEIVDEKKNPMSMDDWMKKDEKCKM